MKYFIPLLIIVSIFFNCASAQDASMEVQGAIQISNSTVSFPDPGTIRYNSEKNDFEGWNGHFWASLTNKPLGTVTDIDGNVYKTLEIGNDIWMIENLRTSKYQDGTDIPQILMNTTWLAGTEGAFCYYQNNPSNDNIHGKLYNWYAVATQQLCPDGWKVPFEIDWDELGEAIGGDIGNGGKLKETGFAFWNQPNSGASNSTGFSARGSGVRNGAGGFSDILIQTRYWALTESPGNEAFARFLYFNSANLITGRSDKNLGYSIRCIKE